MGHYIVTTAAQKRLIERRTESNLKKDELDYLIVAIKRINEELEKLKNER